MPIDLAGRRFGKLTVVRGVKEPKTRHVRWYCQCDCGQMTNSRAKRLLAGEQVCCGCTRPDKRPWCSPPIGRRFEKGNQYASYEYRTQAVLPAKMQLTPSAVSKMPEYRAWISMKVRCYDKSNNRYHRYGARGIEVCEEWRNDFLAFLKDVGPRPSDKHSLERVDNNLGYQPGNCEWRLPKDQARNRVSNTLVTHNGQTKCIAEWAEEVGIPQSVLSRRIREGWSAEDAITLPLGSAKRSSKCVGPLQPGEDC